MAPSISKVPVAPPWALKTWVEKATVWVNGEPVEMDVQMRQEGDVTMGTVEYTVEDAVGEGGGMDLAHHGFVPVGIVHRPMPPSTFA